jgi:parallel beta-helix repeat protein
MWRLVMALVRTCSTGWIDDIDGIVVNGGRYDQTGPGIQAAINALPSSGGAVLLAPGTYTLTSALSINKDNVFLRGNGESTVIVQSTNATDGLTLVNNNITISDLLLRGTNVSGTARGVSGGGNSNCIVERCVIEQWGGIAVNFGNGAVRNIVRDNIVRNNLNEGIFFGLSGLDNIVSNNIVYGNSKNGIDVNGSRSVVHGNICRNNGVSPDTTDTCGIIVGTSAGNTSNDNVITSNVCDTNVQNGIFIWGAGTVQRFTVADNICINTTDGWGINMTGGVGATFQLMTIRGNVCRNNAAAGIVANGIDDSSFVSNICSSNVSHGIHLAGTNKTCARNIVSGNVLRSNTSSGVQIDSVNVSDTTVSGNLSSGNGTNINFSAGSRNTIRGDRTGSFTATAAGTSTISDQNINASMVPIVMPSNAAAGLLTQTKTCYLGTVADGSFTFLVSATGAGAPAGTETFVYSY